MDTPRKPRHALDDRVQYFAALDSLQDLQALFEIEKANAELIRALEAAESRVERERTVATPGAAGGSDSSAATKRTKAAKATSCRLDSKEIRKKKRDR